MSSSARNLGFTTQIGGQHWASHQSLARGDRDSSERDCQLDLRAQQLERAEKGDNPSWRPIDSRILSSGPTVISGRAGVNIMPPVLHI